MDDRCISACQEKYRLGIPSGICQTCANELRASARKHVERADRLRDALCAILSATGAVPQDIPRLAKEALARDNELWDK